MDRFDIPVTLNFARRMGFSGFGAGMLPGAAEVGRLTLQGGRLAFNGQPIGDSAETQLYALCRTDR